MTEIDNSTSHDVLNEARHHWVNTFGQPKLEPLTKHVIFGLTMPMSACASTGQA